MSYKSQNSVFTRADVYHCLAKFCLRHIHIRFNVNMKDFSKSFNKCWQNILLIDSLIKKKWNNLRVYLEQGDPAFQTIYRDILSRCNSISRLGVWKSIDLHKAFSTPPPHPNPNSQSSLNKFTQVLNQHLIHFWNP